MYNLNRASHTKIYVKGDVMCGEKGITKDNIELKYGKPMGTNSNYT